MTTLEQAFNFDAYGNNNLGKGNELRTECRKVQFRFFRRSLFQQVQIDFVGLNPAR